MGAESFTETVADANAATTVDGDPGAPEGGTDPKETPNQEAARHRVRAKDAEAERDALAGVVEGLRTSIINDRADAAGINPALLWASGVTVADLLADEGSDGAGLVDTTKVDAAIEAARDKFGIPAPPGAGHNPMLGVDQVEPEPKVDFADAFKPPGTHP